ncbi:MAG TPA: exosortase N [Flavisolibacter sp.]|nr:exosortase N [Flavisolibacter sp.]
MDLQLSINKGHQVAEKKDPAFVFALAAAGSVFLYDYIGDILPSFLLAAMAVFVTARQASGKPRTVLGIMLMLLLLLTFLVPVKTLLFFSFACLVLYLMEGWGFSFGFFSFAAIVTCSSVFSYLADVAGFSVRLQLSSLAGKLFSLWQNDVTVAGNTIFRGPDEFSVDPACMGLHMLVTSLLLGIVFAGLWQKKIGKILSWPAALLYLLFILAANIFGNLIRILLLVQFVILPDSWLHDMVGMVCLAVYVCLPAAFVSRLLVSRMGNRPAQQPLIASRISHAANWLFLLAFIAAAIRTNSADTYARFANVHERPLPGYKASLYQRGIVKLDGGTSLVYIKFIRGFYDTDHHPSICWKGSGYSFSNIEEKSLAGTPVFTARLAKGADTLYTAWWYGNGRSSTLDQWQWRYSMLKGEPAYAVINITASDEVALDREIRRFGQPSITKQLFKH